MEGLRQFVIVKGRLQYLVEVRERNFSIQPVNADHSGTSSLLIAESLKLVATSCLISFPQTDHLTF